MEINEKDVLYWYLSGICIALFLLLGFSIISLSSNNLIGIPFSIGITYSTLLIFLSIIMASIYGYYSFKIFSTSKKNDYNISLNIDWRRNRQYDLMLFTSIIIAIASLTAILIFPIYIISLNVFYLIMICIFFPLIIFGLWFYYIKLSKMIPTYVGVCKEKIYFKYKNNNETYKWENIRSIKKTRMDGIIKWAIFFKNGDKKYLSLNRIELNLILKLFKRIKKLN